MTSKDLIFDVGMHAGEDTAFYLAKGFNVVAFEANPTLVSASRLRFEKELSNGRLVIVDGAVVEDFPKDKQSVRFYIKEGFSELGTLEHDWVGRNEIYAGAIVEVEVPLVRFSDVIRDRGMPYYLKVDIEGADRECVASLAQFEERPEFVSIELSKTSVEDASEDLRTLVDLGYTSFTLVNQQTIIGTELVAPQHEGEAIEWRFPRASSGAFGADLQSKWHSPDAILGEIRSTMRSYRWFGDRSFLRRLKIGRYNVGSESLQVVERLTGRPLPGWHDLHASVRRRHES